MTDINPSAMDRILRLMAQKEASDVYLSAHAPATIRIDGECRPIADEPLAPEMPLQLLAQIVPPERLQELQREGELNLAVPLAGVGNYRISAMRQRGSYAVVVRYISLDIPKLASLNLPAILERLVMEKRGLILLVGAAGTGKSTTLASMLDYRNERATGHILTIEDPIEYTFSNRRSLINQREVGSDTASLEVGLRNALRQAPDVIMIGEIRDRETMTAATTYAQSGHLCLATLHANNSYQALHRILSFYPEEIRPTMLNDLAATLKAVVSQRLIPTVSGSRIPAAEVMLNTRLVSEMIESGDMNGVKEAMDNAMAEGSQTFEQDIARLIRSGTIRRDEGLAWADSPTNLLWLLQNSSQSTSQANGHREPAPEAGPQPVFTDFSLDLGERAGARTG